MQGDEETELSAMSDAELMELLGEALSVAESMPPSLIDAAIAIHDWVNFDAEVARFDAPEPAVRTTDAPLLWTGGGGTLLADLEPSGWRRVRIICTVSPPASTPDSELRVDLQSADGTRSSVTATEDGEFETELAAGLWRLLVSAGEWSLMTPWFRA